MKNVAIDINKQVIEIGKYITFSGKKAMSQFLFKNGYYRVSRYAKFAISYSSVLKKKPNSKFLFNPYEFDNELKMELFKIIRNVEIVFRNYVSYYMTISTSNPTFYLDQSYYTPSKSEKNKVSRNKNIAAFPKFLNELKEKEKSIRTDVKKYPELKDYRTGGQYYKEKLPAWVLFEYVDFGTIVTLFEYLNAVHRNKILSKMYNVKNVNKRIAKEFDTWLNAVRNLRNKCAHHNRVIGTTSSIVSKSSQEAVAFNMTSQTDLFSRIYAISKFLNQSERNKLKQKISKLIKKFEKCTISFDLINILPIDWETQFDNISLFF